MTTRNYVTVLFSAAIFAFGCKETKKETAKEEVPVAAVAKEAATEGKSITINADAVPDTVKTLFTKKYPAATNVVWMEYEPVESDDLKMDDKYYYTSYEYKGSKQTSWYNNRGNWVKTSTRITGNPNLPDAVNATINSQYPGYTIVEIDKENDKDMDMYEIELKKGEQKAKLKILPNGKILKRK